MNPFSSHFQKESRDASGCIMLQELCYLLIVWVVCGSYHFTFLHLAQKFFTGIKIYFDVLKKYTVKLVLSGPP